MREDAQIGEFQVILCWDQDRFGRFDPIEGGYWILPFRDAGVRLETIAQGRIDWNDFGGRLLYLVQQEAKHAYLRDLSRNVLRGQVAKAKAGRGADGAAPYGCRLEGDWRVVVPQEAAVVRRIFEEYLSGQSIRSIAASLNADGIPSPRGKQWRASTIRSILVNQKYTGDFIWGKYAAGYYHGMNDGEIIPRRKTDKRQSTPPTNTRSISRRLSIARHSRPFRSDSSGNDSTRPLYGRRANGSCSADCSSAGTVGTP